MNETVAIRKANGKRSVIAASDYRGQPLWDAPDAPVAAPEPQPVPEAAPAAESKRRGRPRRA